MSDIPTLRIDYDLKTLWVNGREVKLTLKRWKLFCYLVDNVERYVTTEELWNQLWSDEHQRGVVKWQAAQMRRSVAPLEVEYRSQHGWRLHFTMSEG